MLFQYTCTCHVIVSDTSSPVEIGFPTAYFMQFYSCMGNVMSKIFFVYYFQLIHQHIPAGE